MIAAEDRHLFHYTCAHSHEHMFRQAFPGSWLSPRIHPDGPGGLVWFTDLAHPNAAALGLTRNIIACDRTEYRYRATDKSHLVPWVEVRRQYPWATELEAAPGARPRHWFVAPLAVPVVYDPFPCTNEFCDHDHAAMREATR